MNDMVTCSRAHKLEGVERMKRNTIVTEQDRETGGRGGRWLEKEGRRPRAQVDARPRGQRKRMIEAEGEGGLGEGGGTRTMKKSVFRVLKGPRESASVIHSIVSDSLRPHGL